MFTIKRAYEEAGTDDGYRVLVDRLWPRGVSKEEAQIDLWLKEIAPTTTLRKWFGHDPSKWREFKRRYEHELASNESVAQLRSLEREHKKVCLVYGAKDTEHNDAVVLVDFLNKE